MYVLTSSLLAITSLPAEAFSLFYVCTALIIWSLSSTLHIKLVFII